MISAVLFDLYETLITESGIQLTRASALATALGLEEKVYRTEWKKRDHTSPLHHRDLWDSRQVKSELAARAIPEGKVFL
jgi:FMN phosphatase YigB (HAD superfamily)